MSFATPSRAPTHVWCSAFEPSEPSALPGWMRRHVLAHVGYNALALQRLAAWARTGEPHPMYGSTGQCASEIAEGATWDGPRLRAFVADTAARLAADLDAEGCHLRDRTRRPRWQLRAG